MIRLSKHIGSPEVNREIKLWALGERMSMQDGPF